LKKGFEMTDLGHLHYLGIEVIQIQGTYSSPSLAWLSAISFLLQWNRI
jgi:hypothetical protein